MPQSLARLHIHLVFSTKNREPIITDEVRGALHGYIATVLKNIGCAPVLNNSVEDHIHLLFDLSRTVAISQAVEDVKKSSSKWIKTQGPEFSQFAWQAGYGAFAVSESNFDAVRAYIANQREHHRRKTFQQEYIIYALTQPVDAAFATILYPTLTTAARDQVVGFRDVLGGTIKARVTLRPVHLLDLDGCCGQDRHRMPCVGVKPWRPG